METLEQRQRRIQRLERQRARRRAKALWPTSIGGVYRPDLPGALQMFGQRPVSLAKLFRLMRDVNSQGSIREFTTTRLSRTVTGKLVRWLAGHGYIDEEVAEDAG